MQNIKFSLIMATLGREKEIELFFLGLLNQSYKLFEIIIVDQNINNKIHDIYNKYKNQCNIIYIKSEKKGLSLCRNIGLEYAKGNIIAFPDDDCEYKADTLQKVYLFFANNPEYDFYTCNTSEKDICKSIFRGFKKNCDIKYYNIMKTAISFTIFIKTKAFNSFRFDERLGVGAEYGACEESDLVLFLLKNKRRGFYHTNDFIYHPYKQSGQDATRLYNYGKGIGAFYKKAIFFYGYYFLFFQYILLIQKTIASCILLPNKKARYAALKGRLKGFLQYTVKN
jgi:glycosyltransferase involved in cell wall biosynthesis